MLLTRLYLRNFRVYEDELELVVPPGLVGIYGPNGAGKSTLLEAVLFALWGKARTGKDQVRTSGVGGDCVAEVEFEHEGHIYLVRRTLRGLNASASVQVESDGVLMSSGTRDADRYLESVLGLDDTAFRASVFAEQKQLSAFSDHSPAERRRLVLQLLGVTPLDSARDAARRDARDTAAAYDRARGVLPDVGALEVEADDAEAKAAAAAVVADREAQASAAAADRADRAGAALANAERDHQKYESLVERGKAARQSLDELTLAASCLRVELDELDGAAGVLAGLEQDTAALPRSESELEVVGLAVSAARATEDALRTLPAEPDDSDPAMLESLRTTAAEARDELVRTESLLQSARSELARSTEMLGRSARLSGEEDCPVCGQALGDAFELVQAHRQSDAADAEKRVGELSDALAAASERAVSAERSLSEASAASEASRRARSSWEAAARRHTDAAAALAVAWAAVTEISADRPGEPPPADVLGSELTLLRSQVERQRAAAAEANRIRGLLERRPAARTELAAAQARQARTVEEVEALREQVRSLGFDPACLHAARDEAEKASISSRDAARAAQNAALAAATERERASAASGRLADARRQHAMLGDLESEARHLSRAADLLGEFRNTVVASVGPRLALQAGQLFGELTDHEYEDVTVDPDTFELQISDAGVAYGLQRFSGSEVDLANLAMRVAISEHIHFQSGGSVGLLVLDEVFGPLDEGRKARMLLALERLRGRFRQVLVVTHDNEIKEQLPAAIEVQKLAGRRATASVVG